MSDNQETKKCLGCLFQKPLSQFEFVTRKDRQHYRNVCLSCRKSRKNVLRMKDVSYINNSKVYHNNTIEEFIFELNDSQFWPKDLIGIYALYSKATDKRYVGLTRRNDGFNGRWLGHRELLRSKIHDNIYLQHSFNKYGEDDFYFKILEICPANIIFEELQAKESKYITELKSAYNENGWNIDTYDRFNKRKTDYRPTNQSRLKEFEILDPNGNIVRGIGIKKFADEHGLLDGNLVNVINGKAKSYKCYKSTNPDFHKKIKIHRLKSPKGEIFEFNYTIRDFCKKHDLNKSSIQRVLKGEANQANGWTLPD